MAATNPNVNQVLRFEDYLAYQNGTVDHSQELVDGTLKRTFRRLINPSDNIFGKERRGT